MPIDWKTKEASERLQAAFLASLPKDVKPDYRRIAIFYNQGATYDSIESRFRPLRKLAETLKKEAEQQGIDTSVTPRGRPRDWEPLVTPSFGSTTVASASFNSQQSYTSTISAQRSNASASSSRKRGSDRDEVLRRKRAKNEPRESLRIISLSSGTEDNDEIDDDQPIRSSGRNSIPKKQPTEQRQTLKAVVIPKFNPQPVLGESSEDDLPSPNTLFASLSFPTVPFGTAPNQVYESHPDKDAIYDTTFDPYTEDENEEPRECVRQLSSPQGFYMSGGIGSPSVVNVSHSTTDGGMAPSPTASVTNSAALTTYASMPSSPPVVSHRSISLSQPLHPISTDSQRSIWDFPPSPGLPHFTQTSHALFPISQGGHSSKYPEPYLPSVTASSSPPPVATRVSPLTLYRPTSADFRIPDDLFDDLNIGRDEHGLPTILGRHLSTPGTSERPSSSRRTIDSVRAESSTLGSGSKSNDQVYERTDHSTSTTDEEEDMYGDDDAVRKESRDVENRRRHADSYGHSRGKGKTKVEHDSQQYHRAFKLPPTPAAAVLASSSSSDFSTPPSRVPKHMQKPPQKQKRHSRNGDSLFMHDDVIAKRRKKPKRKGRKWGDGFDAVIQVKSENESE